MHLEFLAGRRICTRRVSYVISIHYTDVHLSTCTAYAIFLSLTLAAAVTIAKIAYIAAVLHKERRRAAESLRVLQRMSFSRDLPRRILCHCRSLVEAEWSLLLRGDDKGEGLK